MEKKEEFIEGELEEREGLVPSSTYFMVVALSLLGIAFFFDVILGLDWFIFNR